MVARSLYADITINDGGLGLIKNEGQPFVETASSQKADCSFSLQSVDRHR